MEYKLTQSQFDEISDLVHCALSSPNKREADKYIQQIPYVCLYLCGAARNILSELTAATKSASGQVSNKERLSYYVEMNLYKLRDFIDRETSNDKTDSEHALYKHREQAHTTGDNSVIGKKVRHKLFGVGTILECSGSLLSVSFPDGEKRFAYPDAFESFLVAEDSELQQKILAALREQQELLAKTTVANTVPSSITPKKHPRHKQKKIDRMNIAFKCNYCNGGQTADCIGFKGICSDQLINYNINTAQHVWCSSPDSSCRQYLNGEISRAELEEIMGDTTQPGFVCYESRMLRDWKASAGIIQTGEEKGRPMRLLQVQPNSLAVLTTRRPFSSDDTRFIFAVFLVDESYAGDTREEGYVSTRSKWKISLTPQQANKMLFWKYYRNKNAPQKMVFGSGLHRYLSDYQAAQILRDIISVKSIPEEQEFAQQFFLHFCTINGLQPDDIPLPSGALAKCST